MSQRYIGCGLPDGRSGACDGKLPSRARISVLGGGPPELSGTESLGSWPNFHGLFLADPQVRHRRRVPHLSHQRGVTQTPTTPGCSL